MRRIAQLAAGLAILLTCGVQPVAAAAEVFTVYLDPNGSDGNDGRTPRTAVKTLARAQAVLTEAAPRTDVEVRVKQGTYVAPPEKWTFYVPGHSVSFLPIDYQPGDTDGDIAGRPVFRGNGTDGFWLSAELPEGHPGGDTNLRFVYLQVERYAAGGLRLKGGTAQNADGITVPTDEGVDRNTVYGMVFRDLGTRYVSGVNGYGGVDTWNSSDNLVENNHFVRNENIASQASHMHGVYFAHHSHRNVVRKNRFDTISGDPVRTRNDSNGNDVHTNRMIRTGYQAFYSEWFCDADCVAQHPGHGRECASHGNVFHENDVVSGHSGSVRLWALTPPGIDYPGGTGCDNEGQSRLRTYGNT